MRRWVPRAYANDPVFVFETGGSTGLPKNRINIRDFEIDYRQFGERLSEKGFPPAGDWLMLGPTGPRRLRLAVERLAQMRGGICFFVDLDPRWVNNLIRRRAHQELEAYKSHVIDQGLKVLRAHESVRCLFTTPRLLEALCEKVSLPRAGITGIFCGGTEMDAQFHRFAREELVPGIDFVPTYGNTLMGLAHCRPFDPAQGYDIVYHPPHPRAVIELVDREDSSRTVACGQTGRVMLTTLTREFFMPRFLERDEGRARRAHRRIPLGRGRQRAPAVVAAGVGDRGGVLTAVTAPVHIPVLRQGEPYRSLRLETLRNAAGGEPVAEVSQANAGLIARDLSRAHLAQRELAARPAEELLRICRRAGELFAGADLPLGEQVQSFEEYVAQLSATTGLPRYPVPRQRREDSLRPRADGRGRRRADAWRRPRGHRQRLGRAGGGAP